MVAPKILTVATAGAVQDFRMMRDQNRLVLVIQKFPQREHPRLQLRQADVVVGFVDQHRLGGAGRQGGSHHIKTDQRFLAVGKLVEKQRPGVSAVGSVEAQLQRFGIQPHLHQPERFEVRPNLLKQVA